MQLADLSANCLFGRIIMKKYKTLILYTIFGIFTTIVNIATYFVCKKIFGINTAASNIAAWFLSVVFAFVTNKLYVFENLHTDKKKTAIQFVEFVGARVLSGAADTAVMVVFVDILACPELPVKIISNVFVIIFNYVASKFFIFK